MPFTPFGPSASGGGLQPYQFTLEQYGAKGDGRVFGDLGITSGTATLASASVNATSADVGKYVVVNGGLAGSLPLIAQVSSISGTSWVLNANATATVTAGTGSGFMASDDQPAMLAAAQAMQTYMAAGNFKAQLLLGSKLYGAVSLYQVNATSIYNTHLPVLYPNLTGSTQKFIWEIIGPGHAGELQFWESTTPNLQGAGIVSMVQAPGTANATFGQQSIIGGPTGGGAFTGQVVNTHLHTDGFMVVSPPFPNQVGIDAYFLGGWSWGSVSAHTVQSVNGNAPTLPNMPPSGGFQANIGKGFKAPLLGNNDDVAGVRLAVEGYETGLVVSDHFTCGSLATLYVDLAVLLDVANSPLGNKAHKVTISNWSCEVYNGALRCNGGAGTFAEIAISLDTETSGSVNPTYDVNDAGNALTGTLTWSDPFRTSGVPVVSGAQNLKVQSGRQARAVQAAPAYVSGTPFQNPWWQDTEVRLTGGTTSSVLVGPTSALCTTSVGTTTPVTFKLPNGWWFSITQTVAPTFVAVPS